MGTYRLPGCLRYVWGVMSKVPTESAFVSSFSDGCMLLIQESPCLYSPSNRGRVPPSCLLR